MVWGCLKKFHVKKKTYKKYTKTNDAAVRRKAADKLNEIDRKMAEAGKQIYQKRPGAYAGLFRHFFYEYYDE